ncbi:S-adenosylmethionine:diacylglycerol 3-amino-3-carboxypropyl transferase [Candidatus Rubidus massiliensis]|nr:S-adenosylmethionine:diacylglycerol 3-amino-3-carboxypropyl transferase [Candidatus Rubidus massiliensis]
MTSFFSRLSYTFGNEDPTTEHKALNIQESDNVVCITASGDRPLQASVNACKSIVTVDANPLQNYLFDLKKVAIATLSYDEYLDFLGATECSPLKRITIYNEIKHLLTTPAKDFWNRNPKIIQKGVLYQGTIEKFTKAFSPILNVLRGKKIAQLFNFDCIKEQEKFVKESWDTKSWRRLFDIVLNPLVAKIILNDPATYENTDSNEKKGQYVCQRMTDCLSKTLAKKNPFISLILKGRVEKDAFPLYLTEDGQKKIQKNVHQIEYKTKGIIEYLESAPENYFNCFSLSDVASYLDEKNFHRLLKAVHRTAAPSARFCMRQFLSSYQIPVELSNVFVRDKELEKIGKEDQCFLYKFTIGTINK